MTGEASRGADDMVKEVVAKIRDSEDVTGQRGVGMEIAGKRKE